MIEKFVRHRQRFCTDFMILILIKQQRDLSYKFKLDMKRTKNILWHTTSGFISSRIETYFSLNAFVLVSS